jgi:hypothetical protein
MVTERAFFRLMYVLAVHIGEFFASFAVSVIREGFCCLMFDMGLWLDMGKCVISAKVLLNWVMTVWA